MRGNSHLIICRYGSLLDGIRSIAFLAKGLACSSVCRLSFGSDIHSRMIFRRVSCSGLMLKIMICAVAPVVPAFLVMTAWVRAKQHTTRFQTCVQFQQYARQLLTGYMK